MTKLFSIDTIRRRRFKIATAISAAILALIVNYLIRSETTPFRDYLYQSLDEFRSWRHRIPDIWMRLNLPSFFCGVVTRSEEVSDFIFVLQWAAIGYLIAAIVAKLRSVLRNQKP